MPTRLPDATFTTNPMYGYIPTEGAVQPGPTFVQGTDIGLTTYVTIDGAPLSLEVYSLTFVLKKDEHAQNTVFRSMLMEKTSDVEGYFTVTIPKAVSGILREGTYYFAFVATKRYTMDTQVVYRGTLNIEVGVGSPNPLLPVVGVEATADGDSTGGGSTAPIVEVTGPRSPDISFPT